MGFDSLFGSPGRWVGIGLGIVGLLAARSWIHERYREAIKTATAPDKNPTWADAPDWTESTPEFNAEDLVQTYDLSGTGQ